jgi:hypothetical protein
VSKETEERHATKHQESTALNGEWIKPDHASESLSAIGENIIGSTFPASNAAINSVNPSEIFVTSFERKLLHSRKTHGVKKLRSGRTIRI